MELLDIVVESLKYPFSDIKQSLILGIPYLIAAIFGVLTIILGDNVIELTEDALTSSPLTPTFAIITLLFLVFVIISAVIMSGIGISVIQETIKGSNLLPKIELKENITNGIKNIIVTFVYAIIPTIIFGLIIFIIYGLLGDDAGIPLLILMLIGIVVAIIVGILSIVAVCRLAETNSISEAVKFKEIYETAKQIGLGKIFGVMFITNLIMGILLSIVETTYSIPALAIFILLYFFGTYTVLVTNRAYGLLYCDRITGNTFQNTFQQPYNAINNQQQVNTESYDFQPNNVENEKIEFTPKEIEDIPTNFKANDIINTDKNQNVENFAKKCDKCGYRNPEYVKICINCGKEL